jgi:hypothetical protein
MKRDSTEFDFTFNDIGMFHVFLIEFFFMVFLIDLDDTKVTIEIVDQLNTHSGIASGNIDISDTMYVFSTYYL